MVEKQNQGRTVANPFTIKLFMPSGNANELKLIEKMNWTGLGMEISRSAWPAYRKRKELSQAGIYILAGYHDDVAKHPPRLWGELYQYGGWPL